MYDLWFAKNHIEDPVFFVFFTINDRNLDGFPVLLKKFENEKINNGRKNSSMLAFHLKTVDGFPVVFEFRSIRLYMLTQINYYWQQLFLFSI